MRRSPKEVVDTLAYSLKEGKPGDEFKVSDIVKKTSMNHVTTTYYLDLIMRIQSNLPKIEIVEMKRNSFIRILEEVKFSWSEEEYVLLSLFDKGAFSKTTAVHMDEDSKQIFGELTESSFLMQVSKKAYLLPDGIIAAARLADKRAEAVLGPTKHKAFDSGEITIDDGWTTYENIISAESIGQEYFAARNSQMNGVSLTEI